MPFDEKTMPFVNPINLTLGVFETWLAVGWLLAGCWLLAAGWAGKLGWLVRSKSSHYHKQFILPSSINMNASTCFPEMGATNLELNTFCDEDC